MKVKWVIRGSNLFLIFLILLLFSVIVSVSANPIINEIMYDPIQSDFYNEWIEFYNPKNYSIDLTNWTLCDDELLSGYINHSDGKIYLNNSMIIPALGYAMITDGVSGTLVYENFNVSSDSFAFHVSSASICKGLSNSGETISLSNSNGTLIDSADYTNYVSYANGNNKSLERVNLTDIWVGSITFGGTPGFENSVNSAVVVNQTNQTNNQSSNQTNQSEQQNQSKPEIELTLNSSSVNINENLRIFVNLTGNATGNLSIKIKREAINGWKEVAEIFNQNNISNFINNLTWIVPENAISGTYKVYARFEYFTTYTSSTEEFNVSGVSDLGEYNLTVISSPAAARFGDYKFVLVKFNSNNYNFPILKFVSYVNHYVDSGKSPCISMDLNKENGCTKVYNLNTAVELSNISRGESIYLTIPLLFKWNCNRDYSNGKYTGKVRVYNYENTSNEWKSIIEEKFNISISGNNRELCKETIKYVEKETSKENLNLNSINSNSEIIISDEIQMEVLNSPDEVEINEEFTTTIRLTNKGTKEINEIKIYSYIYKGNKVLSSGFNEIKGEWKGDWTANQKVFNLKKGASINITLKNRIKDETMPGTYDFKVRAKLADKNYDIQGEINVLEKKIIINETENKNNKLNETENNVTNQEDNETNETENKSKKSQTEIENKIQTEKTEKSTIDTKTNKSIELQQTAEETEFEPQQVTTDGIKFSFLVIIVLLSIIVFAYKLINNKKK